MGGQELTHLTPEFDTREKAERKMGSGTHSSHSSIYILF